MLDVSAIDPLLSEGAHALTGVLTETAARAIEERLFRERFHREWIVMAPPPEPGASAMLLAVGDGYTVVAADRLAGAGLIRVGGGTLPGRCLWSLFERDLALFRRTHSTDLPGRLVRIGTDDAWFALVTPPRKLPRAAAPDCISLHARPRLAMFGAFERNAPRVEPARGSLPAAGLRRVRDYVDAHLDENIDLGTMAGLAHMSVFHFARQFKLSTGLTPHGYLMRRRIEQACEMMARTDLPLSQIAFLTGFADQGHFSRRFRQFTGTSPRRFRHELS